jgi:hypothetical protein
MGAEPWSCFVPYQEDVAAALEVARAQEFAAGRYRMRDRSRPPATIRQACQEAGASGTASVLDMTAVADSPLVVGAEVPEFCAVSPLTPEQLRELYGTERPTRRQAERGAELYDWLDRGFGVYVVVYDPTDRETPTEIYFAGYSFD